MKKITLNQNKSIELIVTGHSLGAATATLYSYFCANLKNKICKILSLNYLCGSFNLITWGSPRVGTTPFKTSFERFINNGTIKHIRAKSDGDIITEIPGKSTGLMNPGGDKYSHIGIPLQCNSTIKLSNNTNYTRPLQCSKRKEGCSIMKGMLAHNTYGYINNMGSVRTASLGHHNNKIKWLFMILIVIGRSYFKL